MTEPRSHQEIQLFDQDSPRAAELLRELHDEVLAPSFPAEEYVPPATIEPKDGLAVIACSGGQVVGGALGTLYPASGALLLEYLAARPGLRGSGVGSALLAAVKERWLGAYPLTFLELDDPRHHSADLDYGDPAARLRFYGRFGIRLLTIPYFQPRLAPDLARGYHLILGVILPDRGTPPQAVPGDRVTAFLREYFEASEGSTADDDPEVRWLLDAASEPQITLVSTEEFERVSEGLPPGRPPPASQRGGSAAYG
jgi:GNAT superfamily N-acetyltransferase